MDQKCLSFGSSDAQGEEPQSVSRTISIKPKQSNGHMAKIVKKKYADYRIQSQLLQLKVVEETFLIYILRSPGLNGQRPGNAPICLTAVSVLRA